MPPIVGDQTARGTMTLTIPGYPTEQFLMAIRGPSSFEHLPPLQLPSIHLVREVEALQRSIVERSGLEPGVYSSLDREVFQQVKFVYDELLSSVLDQISGIDVVDLSVALYELLERTLGQINKRRYESIPDMLVVGSPHSSDTLHQMWLTWSPFTEAIRWLIEIGIKSCGPSGTKVTDWQLARSIALSRNILLWDRCVGTYRAWSHTTQAHHKCRFHYCTFPNGSWDGSLDGLSRRYGSMAERIRPAMDGLRPCERCGTDN